MGDWITGWPMSGEAVRSDTVPPLPVLLCLPPAGAGCHQFRAWQRRLVGAARVLGVQLPGREERWSEAMPGSLEEAADAVADALVPALAAGGDAGSAPLVVFGHSMGGLLGYEIARRSAPYALVVSACPEPGRWRRPRGGAVADADIDHLLDTAEIDPGLLDAETRAHLAGMLRKDAELTAGYRHAPAPRLALPVHVWAAESDGTVHPDALDGWRTVTDGPFHRHRIPGGHNAVLRRPEPLLAHLTSLLADASASGEDRTAAPDTGA